MTTATQTKPGPEAVLAAGFPLKTQSAAKFTAATVEQLSEHLLELHGEGKLPGCGLYSEATVKLMSKDGGLYLEAPDGRTFAPEKQQQLGLMIPGHKNGQAFHIGTFTAGELVQSEQPVMMQILNDGDQRANKDPARIAYKIMSGPMIDKHMATMQTAQGANAAQALIRAAQANTN